MKWIKCSEKMPEEYQYVMTKNSGAYVKAIFFADEAGLPVFLNYTDRTGARILDAVTEWKSQPPEGL
ncbi:DUF551 domain-containing protein [Morganella morganii]|uniref:DUF551 domain-containing protein n=1 Tax=Morganella morganii TaxID=582 RepID=UPI000537C827|nr:DUF551 domain-containing protein [Morganella morganii]ELB1111445.1 DUF551 domain-containing protein [Morganella morganii]ELJ5777011.1 DUF551 domain-containing protein [Morganella morganii]